MMINNIPIWLLLQQTAQNNAAAAAAAAAATTSTSQASGGGTGVIDTALKLGLLVLIFILLFLAVALVLSLNDCEDIWRRPSREKKKENPMVWAVVSVVCVVINAVLVLYITSR